MRRRPCAWYPWDGVGEVRPFGAEAQKIVDAWRSDYRTRITARLSADRERWFRAGRSVRHHADAEGAFAGNPVFDFDFAAAADAFDDR